MIKHKDLVVMACLRQNSRERLTALARKTGMPVSTIYDRLRERLNGVISKHTVLLDWQKLGFGTRATVLLKARNDRDALKEQLLKAQAVNSLYRVNNGWDFIAECVFKHVAGLELFLEQLERDQLLKAKEVHYIVEDIKKEGFLADPELMPVFFGGEE